MALSVNKAVSELQVIFKKTNFPGKGRKTYWEVLSDQAGRLGEWDEEVLDNLEQEIAKWLSELNDKKLNELWQSSDASLDSYDDTEVEKEDMLEKLSEELSGRLLDTLDEAEEDDDYFAPMKKKKSKFDDDDDDDLGFDDDITDFNEKDSYREDYDDDDRY